MENVEFAVCCGIDYFCGSLRSLKFYIAADMMTMMNVGKFKWSWKDRLKNIVAPPYIMRYLRSMRYLQYLNDNRSSSPLWFCQFLYYRVRYRKLGFKLGFCIDYRSLGYGVGIPHHGTIVVGRSSEIGNYAVLHTSICVTGTNHRIGNAAYISTGTKIISTIKTGDNITFGANSVVNKDFPGDCMVAGVPAKIIKPSLPWYVRDGQMFSERVDSVEKLKAEMLGVE